MSASNRNTLVSKSDVNGSAESLLPSANLNDGPRESMRQLPSFLQPWLTALTGRPLRDEAPLFSWSPAGRAASVVIVYIAALAASVAILSGPIWAWASLPLTLMLAAGAARSFQIGIVHHASHSNVTKIPKIDFWLGEIASAIALIAPLHVYKRLHVIHHGETATSADPDLLLVGEWGFKPGMTKKELWKQLFKNMFGIKFHWNYAMMRLDANFGRKTEAWRRRLAWGIHGTMVALWLAAASIGLWGTWTIISGFLAYVIATFPLFQIGGLLQTFTEHQWVWIESDRKTKKVMIGELTFSRYSGSPMPSLTLSESPRLVAWALDMAFIQWPTRVLVLQLDLPNHAFHHRYPKSGNWANAAFAQRDDELNGIGSWGPYREVWGLKGAIEHNFALLEQLPADAWFGEPLAKREIRDRMSSM